MNLPPDRMTPAQIVGEIGELQKELGPKFLRIQILAKDLYSRARRTSADDNTAVYLRYANAWMQFSGMASQGLKRSAGVAKVIDRLKSETPVTKPSRKASTESTSSPVEALLRAYSEPEEETVPYRTTERVRTPVVERFDREEEDDSDEELSAFDEDLDGD